MSDAVHATAAEGFGAAADLYERGRPGYPAAAVEFIVEQLAIGPGRRILDLAAGTGKFTRLLSASHATLFAIEPVEAMRTELVARSPGVHALAGIAEALPLRTASVDGVTVAQAFHWFDGERALAEIHRVLRPDGFLAASFNRRDDSFDLMARLGETFEPYRRGTPTHRFDEWREVFDRTDLFDSLQQKTFMHAELQTPEDVVARVMSISFVAALDTSERDLVAARVNELLATHAETAGRTEVRMPYRTDVFWCERI